jgi:hypothetical protein
LYTLQLVQLVCVLILPSIFASSIYIGMWNLGDSDTVGSDSVFSFMHDRMFLNVHYIDLYMLIFLLVYVLWTLQGYFAPQGRVSELQCIFVATLGLVYMLPVYVSMWYNICTNGINIIGIVILLSLFLPIFIALAQSTKSALLYMLYLPYFLLFVAFFLVFIPAYSFSRLYDTTWGNRATGADSEISDSVEGIMKQRTLYFTAGLLVSNLLFSWLFVFIFLQGGYNVVLIYMLIVFCPVFIELCCSFLFLYVVLPLRAVLTPRTTYVVQKKNKAKKVTNAASRSTTTHNVINYTNTTSTNDRNYSMGRDSRLESWERPPSSLFEE